MKETMEVKRSTSVEAKPVEGVQGVTVRWLWSASEGAPTFALRLFEVEPGASTPYNSHTHEHEVYILSGQGFLRGKSQEHALGPDDTALLLHYEEHQFINHTGHIHRSSPRYASWDQSSKRLGASGRVQGSDVYARVICVPHLGHFIL
jgi:quercetin dioxygenase-like cupin family protein